MSILRRKKVTGKQLPQDMEC